MNESKSLYVTTPNKDRPSNVQSISPRHVVLFKGSANPFSNLYHTTLSIRGMTFKSLEHCYQYEKALHNCDPVRAEKIRHCNTSFEAMRMGKRIKLNLEWHEIKADVMARLLRTKFSQCAIFRKKLNATRGCRLVEDTANIYWGRGYNGQGMNMLGKLLMSIRDSQNK